MKKIFYISVLFFLLSYNHIFSIDTVSTKYLPLKVGNSWTYYVWTFMGQNPYKYKTTVIGTTVQNEHLYYKLYSLGDTLFYRIDSTYGRLYKRRDNCQQSPIEILVDSLSSVEDDSCNIFCVLYGGNERVCFDTSFQIVLTQNKLTKKFHDIGFEAYYQTCYAKDLGVYYMYSGGAWNYTTTTLLGCVINGFVYGDTTLIGINKISSKIPNIFKLYQNYPNPFNPTTKIKFDIGPPLNSLYRQEGMVTLRTYDVLGREISTLVNEQLKPGTYEIEWNASDYPSGVYFYSLQSESFKQTKKMVLIK